MRAATGAAVLASNGAAWGLATGIILCLVVYGRNFFRGEPDATFEAMLRAQGGAGRRELTSHGPQPSTEALVECIVQ